MTFCLQNHLTRWAFSLILALTPFAGAWTADESGSFYINEALVHYIRPENGRQGVSVVMIPGLKNKAIQARKRPKPVTPTVR